MRPPACKQHWTNWIINCATPSTSPSIQSSCNMPGDTLDCQAPQLAASYQTDIIDYQFYGAALDTAESKLYFNDQWTAKADDDLSNYKMSYQLITSDWNNVAQLDLPLVHEGKLRQFSIDIANVPAGAYHLMAIVYDKDSGERQDWSNSTGGLSNMLTLTKIVIPVK